MAPETEGEICPEIVMVPPTTTFAGLGVQDMVVLCFAMTVIGFVVVLFNPSLSITISVTVNVPLLVYLRLKTGSDTLCGVLPSPKSHLYSVRLPPLGLEDEALKVMIWLTTGLAGVKSKEATGSPTTFTVLDSEAWWSSVSVTVSVTW